MNVEVVGIVYIKDGKLLISKTRSSVGRDKYTLIGGKIENGELEIEAVIRETKEETGLDVSADDFYKVFNFTEEAASDPNLMVNLHIFVYNREFVHSLQTSTEILEFKWYDVSEDSSHLSPAVANHLLPWAIEQGLLYTTKEE